MTDVDVYQASAGIGQYQAGIVMTPEAAKALDDQVRACTKAVLREGTDYGHIPGTSGEEKSLWRPGAQKLLQWFGLGCACERIEVEVDDAGRKHGITYRAVVTKRLPDGTQQILATCEGTADYDESKFYQTEEQVKARLRDAEHKWAAKDHRAPNADRWNSAKEYRADWNALMKRAQKRAIVGATVDATAAGGIFTDREEDDSPGAVTDDGSTWYEEALEAALTFTVQKAGWKLYNDTAEAHKQGLISRRQQDYIQNRIKQRDQLLKTAAPVDVEDLARAAAQAPAAGDDTRSQPRVEPAGRVQQGSTGEAAARDARPRAAGAAPSRGAQPPPPQDQPDPTSRPAASSPAPAAEPNAQPATQTSADPEDEPGTASDDQLTGLHITFGGLGFGAAAEDREAKLKIAETITGRALSGGPVTSDASSKNLSFTEARKLTDTLDGFGGDREKLIAYMAEAEQDGDGGA